MISVACHSYCDLSFITNSIKQGPGWWNKLWRWSDGGHESEDEMQVVMELEKLSNQTATNDITEFEADAW